MRHTDIRLHLEEGTLPEVIIAIIIEYFSNQFEWDRRNVVII